ncbi:MAG TPA: hypothetical protein VM324_02380 [Egibacteraceae bacterium]|nr:hypothetical protein [Egibacteraceae bacterium]
MVVTKDHLAGTALMPEQLLPEVALTDAGSGEPWRPSELRQRSAVVLCFLHARCDACARTVAQLAEREEAIRRADAQVRVVLPEAVDGPFPCADGAYRVMVDEDGQARERMLGPDGRLPTVLVADRYTAVVESFPAPDHRFPDPDEVVDTLRYVACDCS